MNKVYELETTDIIWVLNHFNKKEIEVITKYNNLIGELLEND